MKQTLKQARYLMGTVIEVTAEGWDAEGLIGPIHAAFEEFERLNYMFNRFDPESELTRLNQTAAQSEFVASPELFELLAAAVEHATASAGTFDVTVAPLLDLWSRSVQAQRWPQPDEIDAALELTGADKLELDASGGTVRFTQEGVAIDLGGLAKGYAVDRALEILRTSHIGGAFINAGSSSLAGFREEGSGGWLIGLRHPLERDQKLVGSLTMHDTALSSSGSYERSRVVGGRNCSHIVDPRTGLPAEGTLAATVMTDSATRAEVMSKMLLMLGCEAAFERFDELGWDAEGLLMAEVADDGVGIWCSKGLTGFNQL
jgi:FAD:protein FMN transferase